jgi:hypothetical protein
MVMELTDNITQKYAVKPQKRLLILMFLFIIFIHAAEYRLNCFSGHSRLHGGSRPACRQAPLPEKKRLCAGTGLLPR